MISGTAYFDCPNAHVKATLSTGDVEEVITAIRASGHYKGWWECPCEPQHGSHYFSEQEVEDDTAEATFNDEFEFFDGRDIDDYDGVTITKINEVIDVEWVVDEDTIDDGTDDY